MFDLRDVIVLARDASWSSTYKPALLKALTRIVARGAGQTIPLAVIGEQFVELYWTQTVVFHLRQAAVISKETEVVRAIRKTAEASGARRLDALPLAARAALARKMERVLKINVLRAFHRSKPAHMPALFTWTEGAGELELSEAAHAFVGANAMALEMVANYWWAGYLEKVNALAPYIIEKVQRDGARRSSLAQYLRILEAVDAPQCFYCGGGFRDGNGVHVDHVLPWSFLLADPLWDLVMACSRCNLAKSDWLPAPEFIDKLVAANVVRARAQLPERGVSPLLDGPRIRQYYDAARAVEWPGPWSPW
jgi:hypothetical protein